MEPEASDCEARRLAAVRRYQAMFDAAMEVELSPVTSLASRLLDAPFAAVTLVGQDQVLLRARQGPLPGEVPRAGSFCAATVSARSLLAVPDARADAGFAADPLVTGAPQARFYAGVPLIVGGEAVGTLSVLDRRPRALADAQAAELSSLGALASRFLEALGLRAVLQLNNAIISSLTEEALLRSMSEALMRVIPFDRAALTFPEPGVEGLRVLALYGRLPPRSYPVGVALDLRDSHVGWAFTHQRTLLRRDLEKERQFTPEHGLYQEGIRSLLTAPLVLAGHSIGTITLGSTTAGHFTQADEAFLGDVSGQIALAFSNMRAFEEIARLKSRLQAQNQYLREEIQGEHDFSDLVGQSRALRELLRQVDQVAPTDSTVLISGETGTGKELIARAIHDRSPRKDHPLVKVNCGAISAGLVESELFGHVKGAFTGALGAREGRFTLADGGTIFLDEVSELPLDAQVKLLRVLQEQEFEPVGSSKTVKVDVRIIAATNRDLAARVAEGHFRSDLFYRLNVVPIAVPPLRQRGGDIELLVKFFVQKVAKKLGRPPVQVPADALARLVGYPWPGNVRELQNVIERAVVLSTGNVLSLAPDFAPGGAAAALAPDLAPPARPQAERADPASLEAVERRHIESVLIQRNWLIEGERGAAKALNLHPNTLRGRMRRLGLKRPLS